MISIIVIDIVVYHKLQSGSQVNYKVAQNYVTKWLTIKLQSGSELCYKVAQNYVTKWLTIKLQKM